MAYKIPFRGEFYEVDRSGFLIFLEMYISGIKDTALSIANLHGVGMACISERYKKLFYAARDDFRQHKEMIISQMDDEENKQLYERFAELADKIWENEDNIIAGYAKLFNLDLSLPSHRRKFITKFNAYRITENESHGYDCNAPKEILETGKNSLEIIPKLDEIANNLITRIKRLNQETIK